MFGVGFLPYPSVFDKTFSTHYFNGGKQEKMKKRLLSMLMAVLMIASLVPATALAAGTTDVDEYLINIKADAAAKQPGITVKDDGKGGYDVTITPFAKIKDQCKVCTTLKADVLIEGDCVTKGLTVYYCSTCGKEMMKPLVAELDAYNYQAKDIHVVEKPTCTADGWGYAACGTCGKAVAVLGADDALKLLDPKTPDMLKAIVKAQFAATKHARAFDVEGDIYAQDENETLIAKAPVEPQHAITINGKPVSYLNDNIIVDESVKGAKLMDVTGYTGDKYCPDCNTVVKAGTVVDSLDVTHKDYMKVITAGAKPYIDKDGDKIEGMTDVVYCAKCNETFGGDVLTYDEYFAVEPEAAAPKIGDVKYEVNAKAATCCEEGYTGDTMTYLQTGIDKDGKAVGAWTVTEKGTTIDKLEHHFVKYVDKAPTCTEAGMKAEGWYVCDNVVGKDIICTETKHDLIYKAPYVVPATGHNYVETVLVAPSKDNTGLSVLKCACGAYEMDGNNVKVYTTHVGACVAADERINVKEATCIEKGYTGDVVCKICGIVMTKGEETDIVDHKTEVKDAKAATCTEAGYTGDEVCTVCGETVKKGTEIPALGHKFENGVCTVCGAADPNYVAPVVNPFKDVKEDSPYYKAIIWAAKEEITTGKTADTFGIDEGCTRAQIVTFLYRAAGSPEVKADTVNPFTDVSKDSVYYNAILWAVENGITKGTTETTFDPNAVCTRGQIVTFLFRASGDEKVATSTNFADVASGSYCADAVAWAVANKVANGFADGSFRPEATCTRGQAVTFIYRALAE